MRSVVLAISFFIKSSVLIAQNINTLGDVNTSNKHEVSFDLGIVYTPLFGKSFLGASTDMKYFLIERLSTGLSILITEKTIQEVFTYEIKKPILTYSEFGWINQYDIVQSERLRIGLNLNNGISISRLGDNAEKEKFSTRYGTRYRAEKIATNYLYLLQPGIDVSLRIFSASGVTKLYLIGKAKYRWVFGEEEYGNTSDFSGYQLGCGLQLIGFSK